MKNLWRTLRLTGVMALLLLTVYAFAQTDEQTITVSGSRAALSLVESLAQASTPVLTVSNETSGNASGFERLCAGDASIVASTRTISVEEEAACESAGIVFQEYLLGHEALVFVANPQDNPLSCLTSSNLADLLAPSAVSNLTWGLVAEAAAELPFSLYLPPSTNVLYQQLDALVRGDGFRADAVTSEDVIAQVSQTRGALGIASYQTASSVIGISLLSFDNGDGTCLYPSAETIEAGQYNAATSFYLYVSASQSDVVRPLLDYLVSDSAVTTLNEAGFLAPSSVALDRNREVLSGTVTGRQFSRAEQTFSIPTPLTGRVSLGGSASAIGIVTTGLQTLEQANADLSITRNFEGASAGIRRVCNNEANFVAFTNAPLSAEQIEACGANNISPLDLPLAQQAVVLVANQADSFAQCLTVEQIQQMWRAGSEVSNWQQVDAEFADAPITFFGAPEGTYLADILLASASAPTLPVRQDTELDADALYRAAAVANVQGAITYMGWQDYQNVLGNNQERIQLVNVKTSADGECVTPSLETIESGVYPFIRQTRLVLAPQYLTDIAVQSVLWTLFTDENLSQWVSNGYLGIDALSVADLRNELLVQFALAAEATAESSAVAPEATPEVSAEVTPEATAEATPAGN